MENYGRTDNMEAANREGDAQIIGDPDTLTPLQSHYLSLLEHRINLKNRYQADPGREDWLMKAVNNATYSAFRSCVEHNVGAEAKTILGLERQAN